MLLTLVFCIQAVFAVDQNLLDSFKTVKEKFLQAQDALGQFETLLQQETGVEPNGERKVDNHPTGLEKEYRILETMNAWNRMSTWTRPETSSNQSTKAASEAVEKVDRKQPSSLRNIRIGKTTIKIYKDTKNNTMVISMKTGTNAEFSHFQLMARVYWTNIVLLPGMCGKGLCFVAEKNGADCLLTVIADMMLVSEFMEISIYLSQSDSVALRVDRISTYRNDTLLTYHFQEFQVHNEEDGQLILDPQDSQINLHTTINLGVNNGVNFTSLHSSSYKYFEPGTHNESQLEYSSSSVNSTLKDGKHQAVARYDLNPDKPMDGVINFVQQIRINNGIHAFLEIRKRYTVFPMGQEDSTYFLNKAIVGQAHKQGPIQAYLPYAFYIGIYGAPTDISIRKLLKTDFPGFEFLITRYARGQVGVVLTSYYVTLEDAGTYEIMAYFEGGLIMTYRFKVQVVNNMVRIESFSKTATFSTNKDENNDDISIEFTCTALGNPLDTVYFVNRITNDNTSSAFRDIKLENSTTFEIMPTEVTEDSMSRKIIMHKLPESSVYPYEIGCKASSEAQEEYEFLSVYESDFRI